LDLIPLWLDCDERERLRLQRDGGIGTVWYQPGNAECWPFCEGDSEMVPADVQIADDNLADIWDETKMLGNEILSAVSITLFHRLDSHGLRDGRLGKTVVVEVSILTPTWSR